MCLLKVHVKNIFEKMISFVLYSGASASVLFVRFPKEKLSQHGLKVKFTKIPCSSNLDVDDGTNISNMGWFGSCQDNIVRVTSVLVSVPFLDMNSEFFCVVSSIFRQHLREPQTGG